MKKGILSAILFYLIIQSVNSQIVKPVKWAFSTKQINNEQVLLLFKATISSPWHMYGLNIPEGGPIATSLNFDNIKGYELTGKPGQDPKPQIIDDKIFNMNLELHSGQVTYSQKIKITSSDSIIIKGNVDYMTCSDMQCVLGDTDFEFHLPGFTSNKIDKNSDISLTGNNKPTSDTSDIVLRDIINIDSSKKNTPQISAVTTPQNKGNERSLWGVFFFALLAGLGGLLTPCVYPMIPLTVSYFMREGKSRSKMISEAIVFGLSIIFIYTLIGLLVTVFKNPNAVNNFTTHWITNLIFFMIFLALSASFFGLYELVLPSGLVNKIDSKADKGGIIGAFFMALAMAVLSFSCTGPIVASLLIKALDGEVMEPVIGMAGYSLAFALPFTLFAIFPSWLKSLPKSGSWLNSVKIFFAFIMLASSLYFLQKIDQSYHLNLLSRNLFLSIVTVIFTLMGFYFLDKIRFIHDSKPEYLSIPRFLIALISFSFALYLFTGILGNDLKPLSGLLPPANENKITSAVPIKNNLCNTPKYVDFLTLPHGLSGYFDYDEALACAKEQNKPVFVDFVGHTCANCKVMYSEVWSDPRVLKILNEKFIIVALYTDDKMKLSENEWYKSTIDGKVKNSIGKKNQDLQIKRFNSNALPMYAIVDKDGNDLSHEYYTFNTNIEKFISWLESF